MLLTGGLLNATTVLQPQFLQQELGYTALSAGLSLSGGGLALLVVMPMAGQAVSRFPARNLIAMGFVLFALSVFLYGDAYQPADQLARSHHGCVSFKLSRFLLYSFP